MSCKNCESKKCEINGICVNDTVEKSRTKAERRKKDWTKAKRKFFYAIKNGMGEKPLHYFVKGKPFCSCAMCKPKTNLKGKEMAGTNRGRYHYATRNWKVSDQKKIDSLNDQLKTVDIVNILI